METDDAYLPPSTPGLTLVATPIGNLGDLSPRAAAALAEAGAVLCEDTRVTSRLLARHSISAKMLALHDHNEESEAPRLVSRMLAGERFALVSDAGTPLVSDPGYRLVRAAIAAGVVVSAVPGPSAVVMALTLSGLPPHPFLFHGFLPTKAAARAAEVSRIAAVEAAGLSASLVFYEAPHRTGEALAALAEGLGADRPACVARELTKRFEEVRRGSLGELAAHYAVHEARGEVVLCVGPAPAPAAASAETLDEALRAAMATLSVRDAAATVAEATGLPRKRVYARALELAAGR
ncbi:16S rRNA (cytidine(1402)-2'-O)-methyltransferase [Roseococcus pinisoli]|uniref:Ribosomal RNA small subunit methyltransferase I n=1 Tax=Roseococcus pinisoli TaxID=2835040 RepID=A0ABS5Q9H8_9PROT|nr:16S rRNA (cytidine(1402)-2'-O)-methyltransferase [Roseococcus pinisoli]MBS7810364.1 16S rRNA (cytidine(1402)-2'-O)-methyltransferase [Roseococcus pinisoli]